MSLDLIGFAGKLREIAISRGLGEDIVYSTPFAWIDAGSLLGAFASAASISANSVSNPLRPVTRELLNYIALLLTIVGVRADVVEEVCRLDSGRQARILYVRLLDCNCTRECKGVEALVKCSCSRLGEVSYRVVIDVKG